MLNGMVRAIARRCKMSASTNNKQQTKYQIIMVREMRCHAGGGRLDKRLNKHATIKLRWLTILLHMFLFTIFALAGVITGNETEVTVLAEIKFHTSTVPDTQSALWNVTFTAHEHPSFTNRTLHAFHSQEILHSLRNVKEGTRATWLVMIGGSNSWTVAKTVLSHFYPEEQQVSQSNTAHERWTNYPHYPAGVFYGPTPTGFDVILSANGDIIFYEANRRVFGERPDSPEADTLRISFLLANIFPRYESQLRWAMDQHAWSARSNVSLMFDWCNRWADTEPINDIGEMELKLSNFTKDAFLGIPGLESFIKTDTFGSTSQLIWHHYMGNLLANNWRAYSNTRQYTLSFNKMLRDIAIRLGDEYDFNNFIAFGHWTPMMQHILTQIYLNIVFGRRDEIGNAQVFQSSKCFGNSPHWKERNRCVPYINVFSMSTEVCSLKSDKVEQDSQDEDVIVLREDDLLLTCSAFSNQTNATNATRIADTRGGGTNSQLTYSLLAVFTLFTAAIVSFVSDLKRPIEKRMWSLKSDQIIKYSECDDVLPFKVVTSLDFARFMASIFIVQGHLFQSGLLSWKFTRFGFTWVPFYFMMSGFVLMTSSLWREHRTSQIPDHGIQFVQARLLSLYPTYLAGIVISLLTLWFLRGSDQLPSNTQLLLYLLLVQSWVPNSVESGFPQLTHTWFISALVLYWLTFGTIYRIFKIHFERDFSIFALTVLLSIGFPLLYYVTTKTLSESYFYQSHKYNRDSQLVDVAVLFLKYHPFAYFHIFLLGCTLPRTGRFLTKLTTRSSNTGGHEYGIALRNVMKNIYDYGTSISVALYIILITRADNVPGYKLSLRIGLISSVQCLFLLGLTSPIDPVSRMFSRRFLRMLGSRYSYPQYILQFIVIVWVKHMHGVFDIRYFILLFSTGVCLAHVCERCMRLQGAYFTMMRRFTFAIFVIFLHLLPWISRERIDAEPVAILGTDELIMFNTSGTLYGKDSLRINPSIYGKMFVTRGNSLHQRKVIYNQNTIVSLDHWDINVQFGLYQNTSSIFTIEKTFDFDVALENENGDGYIQKLIPCSPTPMCLSKRTMYLKSTTGPEDAKIFKFRGNHFISVFSYLPAMKSYLHIGSQCSESSKHGTLFISNIDNVTNHTLILSRLVYDEGYLIEKNWGAFEANGSLFWVYSIHPVHVILKTVGHDLSKAEIKVEKKFSTVTPSLPLLGKSVHGNVNPVRIGTYFINVYHIRTAQRTNSEDYKTYFYIFESAAPFKVLKYGSLAIPLEDGTLDPRCTSPVAFVSGLDIFDDMVVLAYGVCDLYSRIVKIPINIVFGTYLGINT